MVRAANVGFPRLVEYSTALVYHLIGKTRSKRPLPERLNLSVPIPTTCAAREHRPTAQRTARAALNLPYSMLVRCTAGNFKIIHINSCYSVLHHALVIAQRTTHGSDAPQALILPGTPYPLRINHDVLAPTAVAALAASKRFRPLYRTLFSSKGLVRPAAPFHPCLEHHLAQVDLQNVYRERGYVPLK